MAVLGHNSNTIYRDGRTCFIMPQENTVGIAMLEVTIDLLGGEPSGGHVLGLGARALR